MTRKRLLIAGWLLVLGLTALLPLSALFHGLIRAGGAYVSPLPLRHPVVGIHATINLPGGTRAVVVDILGPVTVGGTITRDIVALGGQVYLLPGARVDGDVLSILGATYRAPGVVLNGRVGGPLYQWSGRPNSVRGTDGWHAVMNSTRLGLAAGLALLLVGTSLTIVFPWQVVLISTTLRSAPLKSAAAGMACLLTFVFLVVPLGLSLAGLPFALLLSGAGGLSWLFGVTACAVVLGHLITRGPVSLVWASAAGLVVMALGLVVPLLGPLLVISCGLTGAGALVVALLSRSRPETFRPV